MARDPVTAVYVIEVRRRFVADFKKAGKHPEYQAENLVQMIDDLTRHNPMPDFYREHDLDADGRAVDWRGYKTCDLSPDLRVIFKRHARLKVVVLHRIGSHTQLYQWASKP